MRRFTDQCSPGGCGMRVLGGFDACVRGQSFVVGSRHRRDAVKKDRSLPDGVEVEFEGGLSEEVTAHGGVGLFVETGRRCGVMARADRVLPGKKNPKGLSQSQMVESFAVLSALGGECIDDFE